MPNTPTITSDDRHNADDAAAPARDRRSRGRRLRGAARPGDGDETSSAGLAQHARGARRRLPVRASRDARARVARGRRAPARCTPVVLAAVGGSLADTARSLSSYCDAIAVHTDLHRDLLELAEHASVPVVNARTIAPTRARRSPLPRVARALRRAGRAGDRVGRRRRAGDASLIEAACGRLHDPPRGPARAAPRPGAAGPRRRRDPRVRHATRGGLRRRRRLRRHAPGVSCPTPTPSRRSCCRSPLPARSSCTRHPRRAAGNLPPRRAGQMLRALVGGDWECLTRGPR